MTASYKDETARLRVLAYERSDHTDLSLKWLEKQGAQVTRGRAMWDRAPDRFSEDEIISLAQGYETLIGASGANLTQRVIEALPKLRYISKIGIGVDSIDVSAATRAGVLVTNSPVDTQVTSVCEHAIAMILALRKKFLVWTPEFMRAGGWRADVFSGSLTGSVVGIVGFGRIGRGVAERLSNWGVKILVHDPYVTAVPEGLHLTDLATLARESDAITLHAAATPSNKGLIGAETMALMKPTAILVNTGRGSLVDYEALRTVLAEGRIAGVGLDVFEREPPDPEDPLFRMNNVLVTPHISSWTYEGLENTGWRAAQNAWSMMCGERPDDLVNPEVLETSARPGVDAREERPL